MYFNRPEGRQMETYPLAKKIKAVSLVQNASLKKNRISVLAESVQNLNMWRNYINYEHCN